MCSESVELTNGSPMPYCLFPAFNGEMVLYKYVRSSKMSSPASPVFTVLLAWVAFTFLAAVWVLHFRENEARLNFYLL